MNVIWYATDSTGVILQFQEDRRWHTLEYLPPAIAEKEVERRNARLRAVYADNGIIVKFPGESDEQDANHRLPSKGRP